MQGSREQPQHGTAGVAAEVGDSAARCDPVGGGRSWRRGPFRPAAERHVQGRPGWAVSCPWSAVTETRTKGFAVPIGAPPAWAAGGDGSAPPGTATGPPRAGLFVRGGRDVAQPRDSAAAKGTGGEESHCRGADQGTDGEEGGTSHGRTFPVMTDGLCTTPVGPVSLRRRTDPTRTGAAKRVGAASTGVQVLAGTGRRSR